MIWWSYMMFYDAPAWEGKTPPSSIADFFNVVDFPGKRGIHPWPQALIEMALVADGVDPGGVYEVMDTDEGIDRAFAMLDKIWDCTEADLSASQAAKRLHMGRATAYRLSTSLRETTDMHDPYTIPRLVYTRKDASEDDIKLVICAIEEIANAMHRARFGVDIEPVCQTPDEIRAAKCAIDPGIPADQWAAVTRIPGVEPHERPLMLNIGDLVLDAARELAGTPTQRIVHKFQTGDAGPETGPWIGVFAMRLDVRELFIGEVDDALTRAVRLMCMGSSELAAWLPYREEMAIFVSAPHRHPSLPMAYAVYMATGCAGRQAVTENGLAGRVLGWVQATVRRMVKHRMRDH